MKYWYVIYHYECPVCGHASTCKERVFDKSKAGHEFIQDYDWCLE